MNRRLLCLVAAVVALTAAAHWPALRNGFIWDDDDHFTANPAMTHPQGLKKIWSSLAVSRYYPLTLTSFWVQRRLWGLDPMPYHAVNITLHAASAVLIFLLLRRLNVRAAWAAAALWAVHPVNVESVAWVTELKNVQSGVFFFAAVLCYLRFEGVAAAVPGGKNNPAPRHGRSDTGWIWYAASLLCAAAALTSKPSTVVLPLVLLLCAWWQRGRWQRRDFARAAPFFALALGMSVLTIVEQRGHIERGVQDWSLHFSERFIVAGNAIWFYAVKTLWPSGLSFVYPRWELHPESPVSLLPLLGVVVAGAVLWRLRQRAWARAGLFGLGYFLIALLPVLGFFDIYFFRYSFVADHFQYLACLGVIALASAGAATVLRKRLAQWSLAAVVAASLGAISWQRSHVFCDDETLWRDTLAKNPRAFLAHNNLGTILNGKRQFEQAAEHFREALRLKPGFLEAHNNLGLAWTELGRYDEALVHLQEALRIRPDFAKTHYRLGVLYARIGRPAEAERHYLLAIHHEPTMPEAYFDLGALWQQQGDRDRAGQSYRAALELRPDYALAHNNLANLLAEEGKLEEAIRHYELAAQAEPSLPEVHMNLGLRLAQAGRLQQGIAHLRKAVALKPGFADAYLELGKMLAAHGEYAEAIRTFGRGLEVEPRHMVMGNEMAWLMATAPDAAARNAAQAIQIGERLAELTERKEPRPLDTLAAAYAEAGRFDDAAATAREALAAARAKNDSELAAQIQARIALYERRQPCRQPSP